MSQDKEKMATQIIAMLDTSARLIFNNYSPQELKLDVDEYYKIVGTLNDISRKISDAKEV